jgi:L-asparaginase
MAYTASALSFLLTGTDIPIVLTGAQRPVTELRSDGRENLVTALAIAAGHLHGAHLVPEVTICFDNVLLRGNRAVKVHADSYQSFASPNHPPLQLPASRSSSKRRWWLAGSVRGASS